MTEEVKPIEGEVDAGGQEIPPEPKPQGGEENAVLLRLKAEAAESRRQLRDLQNRMKADNEARLSEQQRLAELEREVVERERAYQELAVESAVRTMALKLGMDDDDAWRLINVADIEFDKDGRPKNVDVLLKDLIKRKPYLVSKAKGAGAGAGTTGDIPSVSMNEYIRKLAGY